MNVLFVCLGNICRSPSADGMLRKKLAEHGLDEKVTVDSAGTGDWHIGKAPDQRSQAAAAARGYAISNLRARQVVAEDFDKFDYVLAMDKSNIENMKEFMPSGKVRTQPELILERFGNDKSITEVPDPYYGGEEGFQTVLDLLETACDNLVLELKQKLALSLCKPIMSCND